MALSTSFISLINDTIKRFLHWPSAMSAGSEIQQNIVLIIHSTELTLQAATKKYSGKFLYNLSQTKYMKEVLFFFLRTKTLSGML